jgi:glutathione S-transferase
MVPGGSLLDEMLLTMGNKNYSSWSLRPWILMKHLAIAFTERVLALDTPEFSRDIATLSPTKRVPVLQHGSLLLWDSLAICEYVCEFAGRGWPRERPARAVARAACAEMHAGFPMLRSQWPMNARATDRRTAPSPERSAEIVRIEQLWDECRTRFGGDGPWLFGDYSVADAMYAPVVLRLRTYGAQVRESTATYMATVLDDAHMRDWLSAAAAERWIIEESEIGEKKDQTNWRPS